MASSTSLGQERAELAAVLGSEVFKRSPKLSRLLAYLCDRYFDGRAGEIKEYTIALDVLGRDPKFDPQLDAIVRVETHHLRKRLKQYYLGDGKAHPLQIVIPAGQYKPEFVHVDGGITHVPEPALTPAASPAVSSPAVSKVAWLIGGLVLAAIAAGALFMIRSKAPHVVEAGSATIARDGADFVSPNASEIRILAGDHKSEYVDKAGRVWLPDRFFNGGSGFQRGSVQIQRSQDPEIFQGGREGQFVYDIPVKPGTYELRLYFAETGVESEALRSISIAINGMPVSTLDIASDAGGVNTATVKIFKNVSPAGDGIVHLSFHGTGSGPGFLNALELVPNDSGRMLPVRLTTRERPYRDHLGRLWLPDQNSSGGRRSMRSAQLEGAADPELYQTQRFGHFSYSIPVVDGGRYTVTLHFAETWFGTPNSPGGPGSRVFDVYCNGATLLKNFDILKEGHQWVVKVFKDIPASPQGKLNLEFVPIANYALVNAIEVVEQ